MKHMHFSKRFLACLLLGILLIVLCSCNQRENNITGNNPSPVFDSVATPNDTHTTSSVPPETTPTSDTSPLSVYKSVLQNNAGFLSTDANKELNIDQLNQSVSDDSNVSAEATKFAIVDLDNDGTPEVILWLTVNGNDYYGFEVLRYQDEVVYGYTLWYRAFMELKVDGTFSYSSGAADNGFGTLAFTKNAYSIDNITYSESSFDADNNQRISYFVNNESATEDEFLSAVNKQNEKADATWYDFTDDNIAAMLN